MTPHDRITLLANRYRASTLWRFRQLAERYFVRMVPDETGLPIDWDGALALRAELNRMLPQVLQIVQAAGLDRSYLSGGAIEPRLDLLANVVAFCDGDGREQDVLDLLDQAIGVYESDQMPAALRLVNPLHYAGIALRFLVSLPRRFLTTLGLSRPTPPPTITTADLARLEAAIARIGTVETSLEVRIAAEVERQARRLGRRRTGDTPVPG